MLDWFVPGQVGAPYGDAWFYFFTWYCARPPHWEPSRVRGPEWMDEDRGLRYGTDVSYYSGFTDAREIVNTWRLVPGGEWENLGWSVATCH